MSYRTSRICTPRFSPPRPPIWTPWAVSATRLRRPIPTPSSPCSSPIRPTPRRTPIHGISRLRPIPTSIGTRSLIIITRRRAPERSRSGSRTKARYAGHPVERGAHRPRQYFYVVPRGVKFLNTEFDPSRLPNGSGVAGGSIADGTLWGGIYAAEYIMRLSTVPAMLHVGPSEISYQSGVFFTSGHQSQVEAAAAAGTPINTLTLNFGFYISAQGAGLSVLNGVINRAIASNQTTVTGGATIPATGIAPIPALYAMSYSTAQGAVSAVITNKSATPHLVTVRVNGAAAAGPFPLQFVTAADPSTANTDSDTNAITVQTASSANPITVPPLQRATGGHCRSAGSGNREFGELRSRTRRSAATGHRLRLGLRVPTHHRDGSATSAETGQYHRHDHGQPGNRKCGSSLLRSSRTCELSDPQRGRSGDRNREREAQRRHRSHRIRHRGSGFPRPLFGQRERRRRSGRARRKHTCVGRGHATQRLFLPKWRGAQLSLVAARPGKLHRHRVPLAIRHRNSRREEYSGVHRRSAGGCSVCRRGRSSSRARPGERGDSNEHGRDGRGQRLRRSGRQPIEYDHRKYSVKPPGRRTLP